MNIKNNSDLLLIEKICPLFVYILAERFQEYFSQLFDKISERIVDFSTKKNN